VFDERIVRVSLQVNSEIKTYEDIAISANGMKFSNTLQNECVVNLTNLDQDTVNYILTETSPYNLNTTPKTITVYAGRKSYGVKQIYFGNIVSAGISQPPDTTISIKCLTGNFQNGNILSKGQPSPISLSVISKQIAQDRNLALNFQATDKNLSNFIYLGGMQSQINNLAFTGGVNVFIDDQTLVVKNINSPINNTITEVSEDKGMIGIPEVTELGVTVKFYLDSQTTLGGGLQVTSMRNPAANGLYVIYKLGFNVANRDEPFYWIADGARQQ
jgi:hypothetical protein